jgi:hypothetical protein
MADGNSRPNALQYVAYSYGKVLPKSMHAWVENDLAGKGARTRTLIRVTIPALVIIAPLWLIPTTVAMHLAMSSLLFLPFLYFAHALDKIWRTHRLRQHGLNPDLVEEIGRQRDAHITEAYRRNYGPPQA